MELIYALWAEIYRFMVKASQQGDENQYIDLREVCSLLYSGRVARGHTHTHSHTHTHDGHWKRFLQKVNLVWQENMTSTQHWVRTLKS